MKRTTLSLIAGTAALAAVTGFAAVSSPDATGADTAGPAVRLPVERTSLSCPAPSTSDLAETAYTSFTPVTKGANEKGEAALTTAASGTASGETESGKKSEKPVVEPEAPGAPVAGEVSGAEAPALIGTATGSHAPGWTVQQTTEVAAGTGRGLLGVNCTVPDTEFWFPGAATAAERTDYVHLTNPDDSAAVVDIELYGKDGALKTTVADGVTVAPHASEALLLSTLSDVKETDVTVHVSVRSGRVGAAVQALDDKTGGDWLTAAADPAGELVLPGIPEDATAVRLVLFAPGGTDADLKVRLASPTGPITPAGNETVHVKAGMTTGVDLGEVTRGEAGSLTLTPTGRSVPVVAAVRVVRGEGAERESAFIPAAAPVGARATAADNRAKSTTLSLTAPGQAAKVRVTASAGTEGGTAATRTYTIKGGTTQAVEAPVPTGLKGTYALTVETVSGGPVHGARTLTGQDDDVASFTVQTLPDDRGTVAVPHADEDLAVLQR
ncbi:putative secreted protein [Streptomyces ambofaciens ATCC 23877]|uniref:Putative secreted protein n=1 Tax=Streptomyces ambofaciens (strain ATCC 23877 / 3486 / DSM 40053 / JCM 4204 / NBRC 12836 / NRRL B-2516) TaxID=278992 RepID=A0A0K2AT66_STRA7|nr:DUF5719 family protein [Streptomyces ambofaciens]AKZ56121.1 putative secreted protein [Streptomyces ambofaciens ATCC 23877]